MSTVHPARSRAARWLAGVAVLAAAGCGAQPEPVPVQTQTPFVDPFAGRARDALPVVVRASTYLPRSLETVRVTDLDQVRERLGEPALGFDGPSPAASPGADDLWRRANEEAALLTDGLLRPQADRLERDYGFGPDDVLWEARAEDEDGDLEDGWVIALHEGVDPDALQRAVDDGVGVLAGGEVLPERRVVVGGSARKDAPDSWRETRALVGAGTQRRPESVFLHAGCVALEEALGPAAPRAGRVRATHHLDDLEPVEAFAVVFGDRVATARLGMAEFAEPRGDLFARADLLGDWPDPTAARLGEAFGADPVVDPSSGRIGLAMPDPAAAAALTRAGILPYAVCPAA